MHTTFSIIFLKIIFIFSAMNLQAQSHENTGTYLYHIAKFFEWDSSKKTDFVIGIYGNNPDIKSSILKMVLRKKEFIGRKISLKIFKQIDEIKTCNILFICDKEKNKIYKIVKKTKDWKTLIISESSGLAQKGAVVNFTFPSKKVKFELNKKTAKERKLKYKRLLENFVIIVE